MNLVLADKLRLLAENDLMLQAVEAAFNERIEREKPSVGEIDDNIKLGERYRAYSQAKEILSQVLIDIQSYKDKRVSKDTINKGK